MPGQMHVFHAEAIGWTRQVFLPVRHTCVALAHHTFKHLQGSPGCPDC